MFQVWASGLLSREYSVQILESGGVVQTLVRDSLFRNSNGAGGAADGTADTAGAALTAALSEGEVPADADADADGVGRAAAGDVETARASVRATGVAGDAQLMHQTSGADRILAHLTATQSSALAKVARPVRFDASTVPF